MTPNKISIPHVRGLVREDGSSLLEKATDAIVDRYIAEYAGKPGATPSWLASIASAGAEFDSLCRRLQEALADGSVLGAEPASDRAMRVFRRVVPPKVDDPVAAQAQEAAGHQFFLARRLYTLAGDIVDETGADIDATAKAHAVSAVLDVMAARGAKTSRDVIMALPIDEWRVLREAWAAVVRRPAAA